MATAFITRKISDLPVRRNKRRKSLCYLVASLLIQLNVKCSPLFPLSFPWTLDVVIPLRFNDSTPSFNSLIALPLDFRTINQPSDSLSRPDMVNHQVNSIQ